MVFTHEVSTELLGVYLGKDFLKTLTIFYFLGMSAAILIKDY